MFNTSSMQQRIYSNWRQLKFTREAWRCKLLAARHQKTLFRRYAHEDGVFWSIERNAKDLLPGWAMITPFSSRTRFTAIGKTDIGLMGVFLVLNSSIISAANFLVTYRYLSTLNNRKMRDARVFFYWKYYSFKLNDGFCKPYVSYSYFNVVIGSSLTNIFLWLFRGWWYGIIPTYVLIFRSSRSLYYYYPNFWIRKFNDFILFKKTSIC